MAETLFLAGMTQAMHRLAEQAHPAFPVTMGEYGVAEQLSKSKNTSVAGMVEAGILASSRGKVRLLRPDELPGNAGVSPAFEKKISGHDGRAPRLTAWEMVHHLIRSLEAGGKPRGPEQQESL